jgi:hypothetical protein
LRCFLPASHPAYLHHSASAPRPSDLHRDTVRKTPRPKLFLDSVPLRCIVFLAHRKPPAISRRGYCQCSVVYYLQSPWQPASAVVADATVLRPPPLAALHHSLAALSPAVPPLNQSPPVAPVPLEWYSHFKPFRQVGLARMRPIERSMEYTVNDGWHWVASKIETCLNFSGRSPICKIWQLRTTAFTLVKLDEKSSRFLQMTLSGSACRPGNCRCVWVRFLTGFLHQPGEQPCPSNPVR